MYLTMTLDYFIAKTAISYILFLQEKSSMLSLLIGDDFLYLFSDGVVTLGVSIYDPANVTFHDVIKYLPPTSGARDGAHDDGLTV